MKCTCNKQVNRMHQQIIQQQIDNQRIIYKQGHYQMKPKAVKNTVVQFSNLNDNNKTQFLEFLLRNNITFERFAGSGHDDYVAKVTIPTLDFKNGKENCKQVYQATSHLNTNSNPNCNSSGHAANTKTKNSKNNTKVNHSNKAINASSVNNALDKSIKILTPRKQLINNSTINVINNNSISQNRPKNSSTPLKQNNQKISKSKDKQYKQNANKSNSNKMTNKMVQKQKKPDKNKSKQKLTQTRPSIKNSSPLTVRTTQFLTHQASYSQKRSKKQIDQTSRNIQVDTGKVIKKSANDTLHIQRQKSKSTIKASNSQTQKQIKKGLQKQKIVQVNNQIKKKTQQQKQICDLVNKYLKLFDLKLLGQRPIKWSFLQLLKTIQQIYNEIFIKNTQSLSQKNVSKMQQQYNNSLVKFTKQHFMIKYKNEKLASSNLINMLYSLSYYVENQKKISHSKNYIKEVKANQMMTISGIYMQMFQDFLCQIYEFQQLMFYLFIRSIVISEAHNFVQTKIKIDKDNCKSNYVLDKQIVMNYKDVVKILNLILGSDQDLIQQYKTMIFNRMNSNLFHGQKQKQMEKEIMERQIKISGPEFMTIMVEDYRIKRILMQQNVQALKPTKKENIGNNCISAIGNYSLTSQNTFEQIMKNVGYSYTNTGNINGSINFNAKKKEQLATTHNYENKDIYFNNYRNNKASLEIPAYLNINENETDQLTFGQQTQSNLQKLLQNQASMQCLNKDKDFWETTQQTQVFKKLQQNSLQAIILQKMKRKVYELFNILIQNRSEYNSIQKKSNQNNYSSSRPLERKYMIELIMKKSINLLGSVIQMNKLKWFEQLKVMDPIQQDIDIVEQLQLSYRKLQSNPDIESIGKLCKNILTIPQLTFALQKLIF